jgi:hypothetical protein
MILGFLQKKCSGGGLMGGFGEAIAEGPANSL